MSLNRVLLIRCNRIFHNPLGELVKSYYKIYDCKLVKRRGRKSSKYPNNVISEFKKSVKEELQAFLEQLQIY